MHQIGPIVVKKNEMSYMQSRVDERVSKTQIDGFQLNEAKCKELRISFPRLSSTVNQITINDTINDKEVDVVKSAKLLGVIVSSDLKWNAHEESVCKKVVWRLYFLRQKIHAKIFYGSTKHVSGQ